MGDEKNKGHLLSIQQPRSCRCLELFIVLKYKYLLKKLIKTIVHNIFLLFLVCSGVYFQSAFSAVVGDVEDEQDSGNMPVLTLCSQCQQDPALSSTYAPDTSAIDINLCSVCNLKKARRMVVSQAVFELAHNSKIKDLNYAVIGNTRAQLLKGSLDIKRFEVMAENAVEASRVLDVLSNTLRAKLYSPDWEWCQAGIQNTPVEKSIHYSPLSQKGRVEVSMVGSPVFIIEAFVKPEYHHLFSDFERKTKKHDILERLDLKNKDNIKKLEVKNEHESLGEIKVITARGYNFMDFYTLTIGFEQLRKSISEKGRTGSTFEWAEYGVNCLLDIKGRFDLYRTHGRSEQRQVHELQKRFDLFVAYMVIHRNVLTDMLHDNMLESPYVFSSPEGWVHKEEYKNLFSGGSVLSQAMPKEDLSLILKKDYQLIDVAHSGDCLYECAARLMSDDPEAKQAFFIAWQSLFNIPIEEENISTSMVRQFIDAWIIWAKDISVSRDKEKRERMNIEFESQLKALLEREEPLDDMLKYGYIKNMAIPGDPRYYAPYNYLFVLSLAIGRPFIMLFPDGRNKKFERALFNRDNASALAPNLIAHLENRNPHLLQAKEKDTLLNKPLLVMVHSGSDHYYIAKPEKLLKTHQEQYARIEQAVLTDSLPMFMLKPESEADQDDDEPEVDVIAINNDIVEVPESVDLNFPQNIVAKSEEGEAESSRQPKSKNKKKKRKKNKKDKTHDSEAKVDLADSEKPEPHNNELNEASHQTTEVKRPWKEDMTLPNKTEAVASEESGAVFESINTLDKENNQKSLAESSKPDIVAEATQKTSVDTAKTKKKRKKKKPENKEPEFSHQITEVQRPLKESKALPGKNEAVAQERDGDVLEPMEADDKGHLSATSIPDTVTEAFQQASVDKAEALKERSEASEVSYQTTAAQRPLKEDMTLPDKMKAIALEEGGVVFESINMLDKENNQKSLAESSKPDIVAQATQETSVDIAKTKKKRNAEKKEPEASYQTIAAQRPWKEDITTPHDKTEAVAQEKDGAVFETMVAANQPDDKERLAASSIPDTVTEAFQQASVDTPKPNKKKRKKKKPEASQSTPIEEDEEDIEPSADNSEHITTEAQVEMQYPELYQEAQLVKALKRQNALLHPQLLKHRQNLLRKVLNIIADVETADADSGQPWLIDIKKCAALERILSILNELDDPYAPAILGVMWMEEHFRPEKGYDDTAALMIIDALQASVARGFFQGVEFLTWFALASGFPQSISLSLNPGKHVQFGHTQRLVFTLSNKELAQFGNSKLLDLPAKLYQLAGKPAEELSLKDRGFIDQAFPVSGEIEQEVNPALLVSAGGLQTQGSVSRKNAIAHQACWGYFYLQRGEKEQALEYFMRSAIAFTLQQDSIPVNEKMFFALGWSALFHTYRLMSEEQVSEYKEPFFSDWYAKWKNTLPDVVEKMRLVSPLHAFYYFLSKRHLPQWGDKQPIKRDILTICYLLNRQRGHVMVERLETLECQLKKQWEFFETKPVVTSGTNKGEASIPDETGKRTVLSNNGEGLEQKRDIVLPDQDLLLIMKSDDEGRNRSYQMPMKKLSNYGRTTTKQQSGLDDPFYKFSRSKRGSVVDNVGKKILEHYMTVIDGFKPAIDELNRISTESDINHEQTLEKAFVLLDKLLKVNFHDRFCIEENWKDGRKMPVHKNINRNTAILVDNTVILLNVFVNISEHPDRPVFDNQLVTMIDAFLKLGLRGSILEFLEKKDIKFFSNTLLRLTDPELFDDPDDGLINQLVSLLIPQLDIHAQYVTDFNLSHIPKLLSRRLEMCTNLEELHEILTLVVKLDTGDADFDNLLYRAMERIHFAELSSLGDDENDALRDDITCLFSNISPFDKARQQAYKDKWEQQKGVVAALQDSELDFQNMKVNEVWQEMMNEEINRVNEAIEAQRKAMEEQRKAMEALSKTYDLAHDDGEDAREDDDQEGNIATNAREDKKEEPAEKKYTDKLLHFHGLYSKNETLPQAIKWLEEIEKDLNGSSFKNDEYIKYRILVARIYILKADAQIKQFGIGHQDYNKLDDLHRNVNRYHIAFNHAYNNYNRAVRRQSTAYARAVLPINVTEDQVWDAEGKLHSLSQSIVGPQCLLHEAIGNLCAAIDIFYELLLGSTLPDDDIKTVKQEVPLLTAQEGRLRNSFDIIFEDSETIDEILDMRDFLLTQIVRNRDVQRKSRLCPRDEKAYTPKKEKPRKSAMALKNELTLIKERAKACQQRLPDSAKLSFIKAQIAAHALD